MKKEQLDVKILFPDREENMTLMENACVMDKDENLYSLDYESEYYSGKIPKNHLVMSARLYRFTKTGRNDPNYQEVKNYIPNPKERGFKVYINDRWVYQNLPYKDAQQLKNFLLSSNKDSDSPLYKCVKRLIFVDPENKSTSYSWKTKGVKSDEVMGVITSVFNF